MPELTAPAAPTPLAAGRFPLPASRIPRERLRSPDVVRGAVMVLMALDHVRDYVTQLRFTPETLSQGTTALFLTRWVTHFCAPAFFLLAGLGVGISMSRGKSAGAMSRYLLTRGLWLIVLDLVITPIAWRFTFNLMPVFAVVLWALGLSMIVMAGVVHLPKTAVAIGALVMIGMHNLFDGILPQAVGAFGPWWTVLHNPGFAIMGKFLIAYPLIPWVGVMALGWVLADVYGWDPARRKRFLIQVGAAAVVLFLVLRGFNTYGNTFKWETQRTFGLTVSSFLNLRKYPPSLQFLLMTLGPTLVALALVENARGRVANWLSVYGRVPLFYYVGHIFVAHAVGVALAYAQGGKLMTIPVMTDPGSLPAWYGVGLPGVYLAWAFVVVAMYWPCRWFSRLKERSDNPFLGYL